MNKHQTSAYLIVTAHRHATTGKLMRTKLSRVTQNKPPLGPDQVAVKVSITLPETAFTQPVYAASLDVPEHAVIEPEVELETSEVEEQ